MVFRPDQPRPKELSQADRYRRDANRLRSLIEFMRAGGRWEVIDDAQRGDHRQMLKFLEDQKAADPAYQGLSLAQVADDLINRFEAGAQEAEISQLLTVGDTIQLGRLTRRPLEVVRVDHQAKSYILVDRRDRRSVDELVSAVWSGQEYPDGRPVGYEINWNDLDQYAA